MAASMKDLGIDRLSVDERLGLLCEIWDSIAHERANIPLSESHQAELQRRLAEHEANPEDVVPWETIKAEALARFQR